MSFEDEVRKIIKEEVTLQMQEFKEEQYANSQQLYFTKAELAEKWGCSIRKVERTLKSYGVTAVGKRGRSHTYSLETAEKVRKADVKQSLEDTMIREKLKAT